jgi:hypothetical protein
MLHLTNGNPMTRCVTGMTVLVHEPAQSLERFQWETKV